MGYVVIAAENDMLTRFHQLVAQAFDAGADAFLPKPIDKDDLMKLIGVSYEKLP